MGFNGDVGFQVVKKWVYIQQMNPAKAREFGRRGANREGIVDRNILS
jgi:hypothetical protein